MINESRKSKGMNPLEIVQIDYVSNQDGLKYVIHPRISLINPPPLPLGLIHLLISNIISSCYLSIFPI